MKQIYLEPYVASEAPTVTDCIGRRQIRLSVQEINITDAR